MKNPISKLGLSIPDKKEIAATTGLTLLAMMLTSAAMMGVDTAVLLFFR